MPNTPPTIFTLADILAALASAVALAGNQAKWCAENGISTAYASDVLNGRRDPGKKILEALGYEAVTCYQLKK